MILIPTFGIKAIDPILLHNPTKSSSMSTSGGSDGGRGDGSRGHHQVFPTLMATNFISWSIGVQAIMEEQGWWEVVEPPEGTSADRQTEAAASKDKKVRAHLF